MEYLEYCYSNDGDDCNYDFYYSITKILNRLKNYFWCKYNYIHSKKHEYDGNKDIEMQQFHNNKNKIELIENFII